MQKLFDVMGRHAMLGVWLLAGVAAGNVLLQVAMHRSTALTAWKGGGFGMYTEPHPDQRSIVLEIDNGAGQIVLWPETEAMRDWRLSLSPAGAQAVSSIQAQAGRLRFYPRKSNATALLDRAARFRWDAGLLGTVTPDAEKATLGRDRLALRVLDQHLSLDGTVRHVTAYCEGCDAQ